MQCDCCGETLTSEPVESEKDITIGMEYGGKEEAIIILWFCSEECKKEYPTS